MVITYCLMGVVCLCCVFLCIMVSYLCVVVGQIRLCLHEIFQDGVEYQEIGKRINSTEPLVKPRQSSEDSLEPQVDHRKRQRPQGDPQHGKAKPLESTGHTPNIEHFRAHPSSPKPKRSSQKSSDTSKDKNSGLKNAEALERTLEKRGRLSSIKAPARPVNQVAGNSNTCQLVSYQQRNGPQGNHQTTGSSSAGCVTPNIEEVRVSLELVSEDSKSDSEECFPGWTGVREIVRETSSTSKVDQWNNSTIERCGTMDISKIH